MNFIEFSDKIVELLKQKVGDTCTVTVTEVLKNNSVRMTGIVIMEENGSISPIIYLEEPYRQYQDGASLEETAEEIMAAYEKHACHANLDIGFFKDFSMVKDRIFHKVINYEKNKELLKEVPHFRWHDLAVVFYYAMEEPTLGKASILIHNSHLDMWEKTAEEIYSTARHNMKHKMPELLMPIQMLLEEMTGIKLEENVPNLYVLTNSEKMFGASAMLYSEKMGELADRLETDLLILPSSTHEVLLLAEPEDREYGFYRQMVNEVNMTQVDLEEILSFNLYRYDRQKAEVEEIAE